MYKQKSASSHQFAMVPRADIPRSSFLMQKTVKDTFDAGYLVPILCEEVLPGDSFNCRMTSFVRLSTPIFPVMDNLYLETFAFFVPNRLVWSNWKKFMGEQVNPGDSISFVIPTISSPVGGYAVGSIFDHFGLPTVGQVGGGNQVVHNCLPLRAYNLIYNEWFRDENLQNSRTVITADSGDGAGEYALLRRGKRHDYFTSCLPWTQKGSAQVAVLTGNATVKTSASELITSAQTSTFIRTAAGGSPTANRAIMTRGAGPIDLSTSTTATVDATGGMYFSNLYADLSSVTNFTINALRLAFQTQRLLERDARGGTRYTEIVQSHFGVRSPDARLQRPEYIGGGKTSINFRPVAQTSATGLTGGTTPIGYLSGQAESVGHHGFTQSFVEHGYVIMLACVDADLTYQQGLRRMWSRSTRYDFYLPVFAQLGEQAVLNKEIYVDGSANDDLVFGYQERWAEYRYNPSEIRGLFRSTAAGTLDPWHLSQRFTALPTLNATFIESTPPISRVVAAGAGANNQQLLADFFFEIRAARPMPLYSVPGAIDHL